MEIENGLLREEVKVELDNFRDPETLLIINSDTVRAEVELMIDQISKVGYFSAHHSSPGERVETVLVNKTKRFRFTFYRDSQIHNEYWLEYKDLDIGRFQSNCFDVLESQEYGK